MNWPTLDIGTIFALVALGWCAWEISRCVWRVFHRRPVSPPVTHLAHDDGAPYDVTDDTWLEASAYLTWVDSLPCTDDEEIAA